MDATLFCFESNRGPNAREGHGLQKKARAPPAHPVMESSVKVAASAVNAWEPVEILEKIAEDGNLRPLHGLNMPIPKGEVHCVAMATVVYCILYF